MSTLIKNATFVTMDPENGMVDGSILIEEGKVKATFPHQKEEAAPDIDVSEIVDMEWNIVIPGMTNAHYHSYSNLLKGTENSFPLEIWSLYTVAYGHSLTDEDISLAVLLGAAEMIRSGITGCIDHFPHLPRAEAALKAYEASKMHVTFAPMMQDITDEEFMGISFPGNLRKKIPKKKGKTRRQWKAFYTDLVQNWHRKNGKIHLMLGPNAPQRCSDELLGVCRELSVEFGLNVHTHLLETKIQQQVGAATHPDGLIGRLKDHGLLNDRLSAAHAVWLSEIEIGQLKENSVSVIHNPASNMMLGSGIAPVSSYINQNVSVGIGTDAANCGTTHNHFETMRLAAMLPRIPDADYEDWLQAEDVFKMATVSGAEIMQYGNRRGKIAPGYDADLVFLNKNTPALASEHDLISQLVFHENGQSADSVMIKGKWAMRKKEILAFDEQEVIRQVRERSHILKKNAEQALLLADTCKPYFVSFYQNFKNRGS